MNGHAYAEDQLVEQPAIGLFAELGWQTASALEETFGAPSPGLAATLSHPLGEGASLGRETKGEVVLVSRLSRFISSGLERLNPALPPDVIAAVDELTRGRSAMSLEAANREIYTLIKDRIRVRIPEPEDSPSSPALLPRGEGSRGAKRSPLPVQGGEGDAVLVIVLTDEAPRSQYDTPALNMRARAPVPRRGRWPRPTGSCSRRASRSRPPLPR